MSGGLAKALWSKGIDTSLIFRCDPKSQSHYPQYPACTCNRENFQRLLVCAPVYCSTPHARTGQRLST